MEQRLSLVTLGVRDLAASRAFYRRLGWTDHRRATTALLSSSAVAWCSRCGPATRWWRTLASVRRGTDFANISLAHNVRSKEDVDALLAEAKKAGATILKPGTEAPWGGRTGYFADPDGFAWEIAWNPGFEILPDGAIRLPR